MIWAVGERRRVKVTPRAAFDRLVDERDEEGVRYRVWVTVAPEDGEANAAVLKLLAKHVGVAKSRLEIIHGLTGRDKVIKLR